MVGSYLWETFPGKELPAGWTLTGTNPALSWSVQATRSVSTRSSLYGGNPETWTYDHGAGSFAVAVPVFDLQHAVAPTLRFNLFADFADTSCAADFLRVYGVVGGGGIPIQVQLFQDCDGTGGAFVPVEVDLSPYVGATMQLRFVVSVDAANNDGEGVYLDDVRVDEEGVQDPGCCGSAADCDDDDPCTTDLCVGEAGAGVCLHPPLPLVEEDFDDGAADGWTVSGSGTTTVTWFVSEQDAYSDPFSFQASDKNGVVYGNGWTTADSPAFSMTPAGEGPLVLEYYRTLVGMGALSWSSLQVNWQYRIADGGYWITGGNLDTASSEAPWKKMIFSLNPPGNATQVRVRFRFNFFCGGGSICTYRVNIDDFRLGWDGCM